MMTLEPPISLIFPAALFVAMLVVVLWACQAPSRLGPIRRWLLTGFRLIAVGALGVILLGPVGHTTDSTTHDTRPTLCLLIDGSASMQRADHPGGASTATRFEQIQKRWLDSGTLQRLGRLADLRLYQLSDPVHASTADALINQAATARASRLAAGIRQLLNDANTRPGSTMLLASDGHDTTAVNLSAAAGELAALAAAKQVTIHVDPVGDTAGQADLRITGRIAPAVRFAGQRATLEATIQRQHTGRRVVELALNRVDDDQNEQTLDRLLVRFAADQTFRQITLPLREPADSPIQPEPGTDRQEHYRLSLEPLADELDTRNNRVDLFARVIGQPIRVLLIEGQPHWDTRFLTRALRRDRQVLLTTITAVSDEHVAIRHPAAYRDTTDQGNISTMPTRHATGPMRQWLIGLARQQGTASANDNPAGEDEAGSGFDLVILGRHVERLPDSTGLAGLREHVDMGGGLIWSRGLAVDRSTAVGRRLHEQLRTLDPVRWGPPGHQSVRLVADADGRSPLGGWTDQLASIESSLPPLIINRQVHDISQSATVLLRGQPIGRPDAQPVPALVFDNIGGGRVISMIPGNWHRWALDGSASGTAAAAYQGLISDMVRLAGLGPHQVTGTDIAMELNSQHLSTGEAQTVHLFSRQRPINDWLADHARLQTIDPEGRRADLAFTEDPADPTHAMASFTPTRPGIHIVTTDASHAGGIADIQPRALRFVVGDEDQELLDTSARHDWMINLADRTGGKVIDPQALADWLAEQQRPGGADRGGGVRSRPLWNHPTWFIGLLALFSVDWWVRRRSGLR